jgi:hypoxanthine phosphoribosyltransferase
MNQDIAEVLVSKKELDARAGELAAMIANNYRDKNPVFVCVLKGGVMWFADLVRLVDVYAELDFVSASSYGTGHVSSGQLKITQDVSVKVPGRHIVIIDDICDSGLTLSELKKVFEKRGAASVATAVMCNKQSRRTVPFKADYIGFEIEDKFVVGAGLDGPYGRYRNLPYIGVLKSRVYTNNE